MVFLSILKKKLGIDDLSNFKYESNRDEEYLKVSVSDETCFRENKANRISNENNKYTCRVLLQIQSVYYSMKDNIDEIEYYAQVLLEQCVYKVFSNNILIHKDLDFTDTEADSVSNDASEEEINENTMFDE